MDCNMFIVIWKGNMFMFIVYYMFILHITLWFFFHKQVIEHEKN